MGRKPLNPTGPMTATERSKRRYALKSKFINQRRRRLYKEAKEAKERRHAGGLTTVLFKSAVLREAGIHHDAAGLQPW